MRKFMYYIAVPPGKKKQPGYWTDRESVVSMLWRILYPLWKNVDKNYPEQAHLIHNVDTHTCIHSHQAENHTRTDSGHASTDTGSCTLAPIHLCSYIRTLHCTYTVIQMFTCSHCNEHTPQPVIHP